MRINFDDVFYTYSEKSPLASAALKGINIDLDGHFFISLIGQTGSGKSTFTQLVNGLLVPSKGKVTIDQYSVHLGKRNKAYYEDNSLDLNSKKRKKRKQFDIKNLRKKAGLVFQFPEYQLFEREVISDVSFGPKNFGLSEEEAKKEAEKAIDLVGLGPSYYHRSPFELSGGEKRRVAIAGILALEPDVLILDEPTAGLDPQGEKDMMALFKQIYQSGKSVIIVTHNMELVLKYCQKAVVMDHGEIYKVGTPLEIFQDKVLLDKTAIEPPEVFKVALKLIEDGLPISLKNVSDIDSLVEEIEKVKRK